MDSDEMYKSLFEDNTSPMSIWKWADRSQPHKFVITHANNAACAARGVKKEEIIGRCMQESQFFDFDVSAKFREVIETKRCLTVGKLGYVHNRPERTFIVRAFPLLADSVVAVFEDVTDLEETQKKFLIEKAEKERVLKAKAALLARVSHELRTPLNGIIGCTELLMREEEHQPEYMTTIHQCSISLLRLVNDLLDYSKADAGKLELHDHSVILHQAIENSIEILSLQAEEKGLRLGYIIEKDVPYAIVGDGSRIQQILVNLLSNAVKFTDKGEITITVSADTKDIKFSVKDTGIGIPADGVKNLFKAYSQISSSIGRTFGGTGLGLAICRQIVLLMGGNIWVESKLGVGTTVHFTLPLRPDPKVELPNESFQNQKAVIFSKKESIVKQILSHLQLWGISVTWKEPDHFPVPKNDLLGFDLIFCDFTAQNGYSGQRLMEEDNSVSIFQQDKTPIFVAIVYKNSVPALPRSKVALLRLPMKRDSLKRIVLGKSNQPLPQQLEPWANFGIDHPMRILLADDNEINITILIRMLSRMGYNKVDYVSDGQAAVNQAKANSYDLIFLDIYMPILDGLSAAVQIREMNKSVFLCGVSAGENKEVCLEAGMDQTLLKPITMYKLFEILEECTFKSSNRGN